MGIAPLSAWGHSTARTLGRAIWKSLIASLVVPILLLFLGMRSWPALVGLWLCALTAFITLHQFWRDARARQRARGESFFVALWRLAGRYRRRYGGYTIHLGVVLMAIGIIGIEIFQTETQGTVPQGGSLTLGEYTLTYKSLAIFNTPDGREVARAVIDVDRNGEYIGELHPRRDYYIESQQPMTIPGVRSTWEDDLYVILVDWMPASSQGATFKIYRNPLVNWLWLGGFVFILGMLVAAWPDKDPDLAPAQDRRRVSAGVASPEASD
jgi:cytochrome c-type biogenesis protein CcmF